MFRFLILFLFGYLVYQFFIKPLFVGMNEKPKYRTPQEDMAEMLRRMQQFQQQQYEQQQKPQKAKSSKSDGEYIDYEEVD